MNAVGPVGGDVRIWEPSGIGGGEEPEYGGK